jgi:hypothetical protein
MALPPLESRPRRLTSRDAMVVVAIASLPLAAVALAARSATSQVVCEGAAAVSILTIGQVGLLWYVSGVKLGRRWRWLDGPLSLLSVLLALGASLGLLVLTILIPIAALMVAGAVVATIAYAVSWV